jgi:hypothetical protein
MRGKVLALEIMLVCTVLPLLSVAKSVVQETYRGLLFGEIGLRPDAKLDIESWKAIACSREAIDIIRRKL